MTFVILMFSVERIEYVVSYLEGHIPSLKGKMQPFLDAERAKLHSSSSAGLQQVEGKVQSLMMQSLPLPLPLPLPLCLLVCALSKGLSAHFVL
jgi:hypothetical protein